MYQNASIFQRKTVIFNLGNGKSIINEFNLNTTILFIKIYIRDRLNISNFDLLYNSNPIKSNSIPLYRFFTNINKKSIKFTIKQRKSIENKINIKLYEKEYTKIKNTNIKLMNNIKTYKNNISQVTIKENTNIQRYKSLENLLLRQNEEINRLKKEINDANNRYIKLKQKKPNLKYIESNNNFSIISSKYKIPKCLSMESFNTMYLNNSKNNNTYYRTQNNTNANVSNPKERSSFELIRDLSSIDNNSKINYNYNETNNNLITNYNETSILNMESNPNTYRLTRENYNECSNLFKDYNKISRNENAKKKESIYGLNDNNLDNKNHSVIKYRYQLKEYNINEIRQKYANKNKNENEDNNINVSQNIQEKKEEDKIDFTEIVDCFKQINDINDKIKQRMNNISDRHRINRNFIQIFKYLNCEDIYSFSIVNKSSGVCSYYYLLNIFLNKIDYYNTKYSSLKTRYEELLSSFTKVEVKSNLILSNNSKSGLRILNSPHYINTFNNPIEYFTKNKNGLFIYKILFQFSTNKIPIEDDNLFISKMFEEIKAKTAIKKSIRDFIYNLIDKNLDFSFDNINKCKELMKQYNIENMEINNMGEMDRPTTIIGYVVKDIMEFNGLIKAEDKKAKGFGVFVKKDKKDEDDSKNNGLKNKILSVCELIEKEILKCENSCKKIEEIISKYY
jgi:hypothetical protein